MSRTMQQDAKFTLLDNRGNPPIAGRCSLCQEVISLNASAVTDPLLGQRELRNLFDVHVREKHTWRADGNQTAAFRLREMMKEFES